MIGAASIRQAARKHPRLVDALLATLIGGVALLHALGMTPDRLQPTPVGIVGAGLAFLLLLFRRRAPLIVLTLALVGAVGFTLFAPGTTFVLGITVLIALYTVTSTIGGWPAVAVTSVTAVSLYVATVIATGSLTSPQSLAVVAWSGMAAAVGATVRTGREYLRAVEERAERAEATREEEARRRVAEERLHIARELHDVIAHNIALINVQAGVADHLIGTQPDQAEVALRRIREASRTVLEELDSLLYVLRRSGDDDSVTEPVPGLSRLGSLLESLSAAGLHLEHSSTGSPHPLPVATDLAAYRIIQEGLTNAHKHGSGATTLLLLEYSPEALRIEIRNPNESARSPADTRSTGHGLPGMRERALAVGGTLHAGPEPDGMFRLEAWLPTPEAKTSWDTDPFPEEAEVKSKMSADDAPA